MYKQKNRRGAALPYALFALLLGACATAAAPPPAWVFDMSAVYPDGEYVAQQGAGKTPKEAELNGLAAISLYFETKTRVERSGHDSWTRENGTTTAESRRSSEDVNVQSQTSLAAVRYARDPWFNPAVEAWLTVAFIRRDEAWRVYEPRFKRQADAFAALYAAAEAETDSFKKALRYEAAMRYAGAPDFENAATFGQILYPERMNAEFAAVRGELARLPQKIDGAKRGAAVFVDCPGVFESLVTNAFSRALSAEGFPVAKTREGAAVVCAVRIDEGRQERELGVFYNSSLQAVFAGAAGTLLTFNAVADRASAVTPDVAKRRAYAALAEKVAASFSTAGKDGG
jgi:hypothetical protein